MVRKIESYLVDDLDQSRADETVAFALDKTSYEIDLNKVHSKQLRDALKPYIESGQRVSGRRREPVSTTAADVDRRTARAWQKVNRVDAAPRGCVSASVVAQFREAGS